MKNLPKTFGEVSYGGTGTEEYNENLKLRQEAYQLGRSEALKEVREMRVSWDIADGTDNWVVQFWGKKDEKIILLTQLNKNSDDGGSFFLKDILNLIK